MAAPSHPPSHPLPGRRTDTLREFHWTRDRHGRITALCEEAVAGQPAVRSLAHYSSGILDFAVCAAGRSPLSGLIAEPDEELQDEALPGSRLLLCTQDLGAALRPLGTGELMRTVVANARGGLWGGRIKPGEFLAALTDDPHGVRPMDAAMNRLTTRIRVDVHSLPDELPGGAPEAGPVLRAGGSPESSLRVDFGTGAGPDTGTEARLRDLWHRHVDDVDLQYAAYYRDWTLVCAGDTFDSPALGPRFIDVSVRTRRTAYRDLSRVLRGHLARLTDALHLVAPATDGHPPLDRLVLDVQEGAVYVLWVSPREFVIGVTLDQLRVAPAEHRLRRLVREVRGLSGGRGTDGTDGVGEPRDLTARPAR
ncbi:hypothetical protein OG786_10375 [Streptomyces sp. NBC_00101]|uniref:hypothetical protein n=1 Tax=Streptomyces sp. NBC_00101 TaxID=2975651 RepID=UPI003251A66B